MSSNNREDRFLLDPLVPVRSAIQFSYNGSYSLFLVECQRQKILTRKQLKNHRKRPEKIGLIADGILQEGRLANQIKEAAMMVQILLLKRDASLEEIYSCIIRLYTMETFLYRLINATLRLAEENLPIEEEYRWREKLMTLGPFALILDCALCHYSTRKPMMIYRCAQITHDQVEQFRQMNLLQCGYFSGFTSCSRSLAEAEQFEGNVLFRIKLPKRHLALSHRQAVTDVQIFSEIPEEQEILIRPATLFHVKSVRWIADRSRHEICLKIV